MYICTIIISELSYVYMYIVVSISKYFSLVEVQLKGLEPSPKYMDMNLNHARMPIPPQLHATEISSAKILYLNLRVKSMEKRKELIIIVSNTYKVAKIHGFRNKSKNNENFKKSC